ncbi:MAG: GHMP kinase [Candidatus Bathyarchaeota archaeon]|nr:GHMP kinase [Candidatus Bathyarchaeota archaeon]
METKPDSYLCSQLKKRQEHDLLPAVIAYQRIDGPGSSLDLREFQQALWRLPRIPQNIRADPSLAWTRNLPRTIAISIDTGTKVTAYPFEAGMICVESRDYGFELVSAAGEVLPTKESWLLKIADTFSLSGVKFVLENLRPNIKSSGLGGSATAAVGLCILANDLAGKPFSRTQLIALASRMEQDLGVSIVGTQEQSNVLFGGVTDYVWFPWGYPNRSPTGFGASLRSELLPPSSYLELESHMAIYHSGKTRNSSKVNSVWREALSSPEGFGLQKKTPHLAYEFREALRLRNWTQAANSIRSYREIRTILSANYMDGSEEMANEAQTVGCEVFPLGAGGGGAVFFFSDNPRSVEALRDKLSGKYEEIPFHIKERGHELINPISINA